MNRIGASLCVFMLAAFAAIASAGDFSYPLTGGTEPAPRPGPGSESDRSTSIARFLLAESDYAAGKDEKALKGFLDIAYTAPDDERKGFVWMRVGELLLDRGDCDKALEAADKAILLSRARFVVLSAMDLKLRIYQKMEWNNEARQLAGYLVDQKYVKAYLPSLLALMARSEARAGKIAGALALYRKAIAATDDAEEIKNFTSEREYIVEDAGELSSLQAAVLSEEDPEVRSHLFLSLGRAAEKNGFYGMARYAFERAASGGGKWSQASVDHLYRIDQIFSGRPKIIGLVPLTGKFGDLGFAILSGAEVALSSSRWGGLESGPLIRWVDTAGEPEQARAEFMFWSFDKSVVGFLGPVTGEEGRSVSTAFGAKSPPVLYLGQKTILEKPFLYGFGLSPLEEARAILEYLSRDKEIGVLLMHPENGYGKGFADAVSTAAYETGTRIVQDIGYPPEARDFTGVIRKAVGDAKFRRQSRTKEKGSEIRLPIDRIIVADRWDRVFMLASQLNYYNVYLPLAGFSGWNNEELLRKAGDAVSGAVISVDYSDAIPGSMGDRFRNEFQEAMRSAPTRFEAMGYDGAQLMVTAFMSEGGQGKPIGEAMREKIPRMRNYLGVTGDFMFNASGGMQRKVSLLRVDLGNFVPVPAN